MLREILEMLQAGFAFALIPFCVMVAGAGAPAFYVAVALFAMGCGYYIGFNRRT
jgi:hypothetical protein